MIFTQVQSDDEDDKESVASSNYISNNVEENIAQTYHITLIEDGEVEEEDAEDAPAELEEGIKATIDELKKVNLGDIENPRPIYISASLTHGEEGTYVALLHEFKDVFAWSYKEMPGLDPKVAVHHLSVKKGARPVKQGQRRFRPELIPLIEGEVNKLIEVGFIREVKYPMWISSIVPVRKKNGQIRVCVDFRDLNNACPKDDFPLPIAELMIDATTGHEALSFMDGSSGYNQIRMAPTDEELTAFRTPKGRPLILYVAAQERSANPLKYVMAKPVLSDRLARWYLQLQQFEITYVPQKAVKGQVLADFLADHPMPAEWELSDDLPDEDVLVIEVTPPWKMYFDGASHKEGAGAGVVFVTSEGELMRKQLPLKVYGDSQLVVNQLLGLYEVKKPELLPYHNYAKRLMGWLGDVELEHLPRKDNKQADALAKLASTLSMTDKEARIPICKSWVIPPIFSDDEDDMLQEEENHVTEVFEVEEEDWRQPLVDYLKYGKLPNDLRRRTDTRRRATRFIYYKGTLYRRSFDGLFLRCLSDNEKVQAMEEAHSGICGAHQSGPKLHFRIKRMGYYWLTMVKDCMDYARRCQACQFHANLIHQPPEPLHPTVASWPFDAWGLDVVGPLTKSSGGHLYILAATDYFSKWAEAVPLKEVKGECC
ncbi:UNVERIFIED_CONTAM: Transposon Tf2-12 polyprotein [Sesamum radiatum]|uniref:Transposon Tf2-12 polyprotein n=1 Tax=Sesamum radiatum TaxID=300843 RepID=A0AAW2P3H3_SESRA